MIESRRDSIQIAKRTRTRTGMATLLSDQARHVRNEVSALPDTRDKLARV